MIYHLKKNNCRNFKIMEENRLPARSFFIPFANRKLAENINVEDAAKKSGRVISLNGKWDFTFFSKGKVPDKLDINKIAFNKINVPHCWQLQNFEAPFYVKERYPFNCNPPLIPTKKPVGLYYDGFTKKPIKAFDIYNTCGIYRKYVDIMTNNRTFILSFFGVSSCFDLYVNGNYVGYSEGSFNIAEFDVTPYFTSGRNEIVVVVRKWSVGSYLESQDMFRLSGIFRDVMLFCNNKTYIYDYSIKTIPINKNGGYQLNLTVNVKNHAGYNLRITLEDQQGDTVYKNLIKLNTEETLISFQDNFQEYSAENPSLYKLYLSLVKNNTVTECICKNVGFKRIEISNGIFCYNGKPIKINGICYDDWNSVSGYYLSYENMKRDILLLKEYNINTIRFIKPPHPIFVELCELSGFYVIAEADIDTSGTAYSPFFRPDMISKKKTWQDYYLDRVKRLYQTLKNQVSVIIWSLGSSSGGNVCQDYCYDYLKKVSTLPVCYDGAANSKVLSYDIFALRNCNINELLSIPLKGYKGKMVNKPILLTEYLDIKGVNAGQLKEYNDIFNSKEYYMGGCIKSFCDKAIYSNKNKYQYSYGGDFGEFITDKSACLNGIFTTDRKPHFIAENVKYVFRPVTAKLIDDNTIEFTNNRFFKDTSDIKITLEVYVDGYKRNSKEIDTVLTPRQSRRFDIFIGHIEKDMFLNINYTNKDTGDILITKQITVNEEMPVVEIPNGKNISVKEMLDTLTVNFDGGFLRVDKNNGCILNYNINGTEFMEADPARRGTNCFSTNILRPLTQREKSKKNYKSDLVNITLKELSYKIKEEQDANRVEITVNNTLYIKDKECYVSQDMYVIYASGKLDVYTTLHPRRKKLDELKCFGKVIKIPLKFNEITYYGRGEQENYPDIKEHAIIGIYNTRAEQFAEQFILPQEGGNRCDTRYAMVKNAQGEGLLFSSLVKPFNFKVRMFPKWKLDTANHIEDLGEPDGIYLHIDGELSGIGNSQYGVSPKHRIKYKDSYVMGFSVVPFNNNKK